MPYRSDDRSEDDRARHAAERASEIGAAERRVRAAAGALKTLERRLAEALGAAEAEVTEAEDAHRRAVSVAIGRAGAAAPGARDAIRTGGAIAALERAMAGRRRAGDAPPKHLDEAKDALRHARAKRSRLHAQANDALAEAKRRVASAVAEYDALRSLDT